MKPILQRVLMAYRPLYLRGLLLDGQYRLPKVDQPTGAAKSPGRTRRRSLLSTLTHLFFHSRSKP